MSDPRRQTTHVETLRLLGSPVAEFRERAHQDMKFDGPHTAAALLAAYSAGMAAWRQFNRTCWYACAAAFSVLITWFCVLATQPPNAPLLLATLFAAAGTRSVVSAWRREELQRGMAAALWKFDDLALLDVLVELRLNSTEAEMVVAPLCRVLAGLKPSDSELVTQKQRAGLYSELDQCNDHVPHSIELILAILKALEQIGDTKSLPHVRKLAVSGKDRRIQRAAKDCIPFVEAHCREASARASLLRSASAPNAAQLLRAAADTVCEPEQLLRPIEEHHRVGPSDPLR